MNYPRVLYDNILKSTGVTVAYGGTETSGFNKESAYDYKDFSTFQPQVNATTNLEFTMGATQQVNCWGFFAERTGNSGTFTAILYYESSPASYTTLDTITSADGKLVMNNFSQVAVLTGRVLGVQFVCGTGPFRVRQVMAGIETNMEQGHYVGVSPPTLSQGIVQTNNLSENGSILGSNVKRIDVKNKLSLKHVTETWVRDDWNPFAIHASKGRGFFYKWNPVEYDEEVVYCVASKVDAPKNISPTPLMSVGMDLICRQPDPT
jgi:hypothetical protein